MESVILLIWDTQALIGMSLIICFVLFFCYVGFSINEEVIRKTMHRVAGEEPFHNAAKFMNYGIKLTVFVVGLGTLFFAVLVILSSFS